MKWIVIKKIDDFLSMNEKNYFMHSINCFLHPIDFSKIPILSLSFLYESSGVMALMADWDNYGSGGSSRWWCISSVTSCEWVCVVWEVREDGADKFTGFSCKEGLQASKYQGPEKAYRIDILEVIWEVP